MIKQRDINVKGENLKLKIGHVLAVFGPVFCRQQGRQVDSFQQHFLDSEQTSYTKHVLLV